jgi:hypothetical protein
MRNDKLNSLDHLDPSDKELLAKFGPFFDVLYHKFSLNQIRLLNDTVNHLPSNLFSNYIIPPPKKLTSDIKAFSIQKQVLALAQELSLIFREMKTMVNVKDNDVLINHSLDKATQILVLAGYTLARIGTLASLERLELTNPKIARYLRMSNKEPIYTPAMQQDWDTLKKTMGNSIFTTKGSLFHNHRYRSKKGPPLRNSSFNQAFFNPLNAASFQAGFNAAKSKSFFQQGGEGDRSAFSPERHSSPVPKEVSVEGGGQPGLPIDRKFNKHTTKSSNI